MEKDENFQFLDFSFFDEENNQTLIFKCFYLVL